VPAVVAGLLIFGAMFGTVDLPVQAGSALQLKPDQAHAFGSLLLFGFGVSLFIVMCVYVVFYQTDALYADRKDRSILFWKSLPLSDTQIVLSKLLTATVIIPLAFFIAANLTTLMMAAIISFRAGAPIAHILWQPNLWLQLQVLWLYLIVTMAIWFLPIYGYLLFVSAWARRAVLLWVILPPALLVLAEKSISHTGYFAKLIGERLGGLMPHAFLDPRDSAISFHVFGEKDVIAGPSSVWQLVDPVGFFTSPAVWIGVGVGAAFVYGAIELRRRRMD
jgi:ABC-2 type transport system permease protein